MNHDLEHYLGREFQRRDARPIYAQDPPVTRMPLYHLIGALDPLENKDIDRRIDDGLPETLPEWIRADGLTHLKTANST